MSREGIRYSSSGFIGSSEGFVQESSGYSSSRGAILGISRDQAAVNSITRDLLNRSSISINGGGSAGFDSNACSTIEQAILKATNPIEVQEAEELTVAGFSGQWINKDEVNRLRGDIAINQCLINEDSNPEVIRKKTQQQLLYEQEVAIRFLRSPTSPPPDEIVIK